MPMQPQAQAPAGQAPGQEKGASQLFSEINSLLLKAKAFLAQSGGQQEAQQLDQVIGAYQQFVESLLGSKAPQGPTPSNQAIGPQPVPSNPAY